MSSPATQQMQPAIGIEGAPAAMSMEWDRRSDPASLLNAVKGLDQRALTGAGGGVVVGLGHSLLAAVGADIPGLHSLERISNGRYAMPGTPHDLWVLVLGTSASDVFERADVVQKCLLPHAHLRECTSLFAYRQGKDLTGFTDGSANPKGDDAWEAALIPEGDWQNGSFAFVQRWLHFRERFSGLHQTQRDHTIGRQEQSDEELSDAPKTAHIKRTEQEDYDPPAFVLRRSMPWGDARRNGLQFLAFMNDLSKVDRMLQRMMGLEDGHQDRLLGHSQPETGAYYFVPPLVDGRLKLPNAPAMSAPVSGPLGEDEQGFNPIAPTGKGSGSGVIRLREDGPLVIQGNFEVAGKICQKAALCRCGQSATRPFCDGAHKRTGFQASGEAGSVDFGELAPAEAHGCTRIQPIADGPLVVHGAVELLAASGTCISKQAGPTLCRCGHSGNKPFCDGSHARVGFRADN